MDDREASKRVICDYLKRIGMPVNATGAVGRAFHGLYNCDQKPLDVILSLDADGSVRLYCQSQYPLEGKSSPAFDRCFFAEAFPEIEKKIKKEPCLYALRRRTCNGRCQRIVMDVKIAKVNWEGVLDNEALKRVADGYAALLKCLGDAKVFAWQK